MDCRGDADAAWGGVWADVGGRDGSSAAWITSAGAQGEPIRVDQRFGDLRFERLDYDHDGTNEMGDRVAVRGPLADPFSGERVGLAFWDCVTMTRVVSFEPPPGLAGLHGSDPLTDGDITIQGTDPGGYGASVFALTGGTGLYRNARGEADVVDAPGPDRTEITIQLEPCINQIERYIRGHRSRGRENDAEGASRGSLRADLGCADGGSSDRDEFRRSAGGDPS
jgi:hypothetical protein